MKLIITADIRSNGALRTYLLTYLLTAIDQSRHVL